MTIKNKIYIIASRIFLSFAFVALFFDTSFAQEIAATKSIPELKPFAMDIIGNLVPDEDELRAGLLYDTKRGVVVWQKDMDDAWPIASLTKMMVGLLAVEDVEAGRVSMDDTIYVQNTYKKRIKRRKYKMYKVTERYLFSELLKMAMIRSHNESTVWIAKHCSGTVEAFIERMNQMSAELGMTRTHYNNTSGLPAPGALVDNSSTPRDLLLLALECLKHQQLMVVTAMPYATVNNGLCNINYRNHNGLTINYTGEVDGIKTGYTKAAGFCMVATSGRADHRLISITLGVRSPWIRNGIMAGMMNEYYGAIKLGRLGEEKPDLEASNLFLDSLSKGLVAIVPRNELKHQDTTDVAYAYTYKTEFQKVKKTIIVRSGDNLSSIATKNKCTVAELKKWNKLRSTKVMKGQSLFAYVTVKKRIQIKLEVMPDEDVAENDSCVDENVAVKDPVTSLKSHGIVAATPKTDSKKSVLAEGKSVKREDVDSVIPKIILHKVQHGDTLWNIAQRYNTTIQELNRVNGMNGSQIQVGVKIKVPVAS